MKAQVPIKPSCDMIARVLLVGGFFYMIVFNDFLYRNSRMRESYSISPSISAQMQMK
jgi:hypothetical protein